MKRRHALIKTKYTSPVIAIIKYKVDKQVPNTDSKARMRKQKFGIFTKKGENNEY